MNYGIEVNGDAAATGFRVDSAGIDFPTTSTLDPGIGISFEGASRGAIYRTEIFGSFDASISDTSRDGQTGRCLCVRQFLRSAHGQRIADSGTRYR